eukprot:TRINITY_DN77130_c0_g1_i1.p1 TRINITY_DN77130_c0_g1~~TRINITY_DN77130_c0_g1_i1.p1  ORF type:complete len:277 (+),score=76.66 TRINITY_DN77130_c0_g1_i1:108-938(+)
MAEQDECKRLVISASVAENAAIDKDRAGDAAGAIKGYEECEGLLAQAIALAMPAGHTEDHPKLVQHRREVLDRISHLKALGGKPATIPVEQQIRAVQLGMQATTAASHAASAAGGYKQMAAVAAVGAVGGAVVLGSTLGCFMTAGAVGGAAVAGVAATRSDKVGEVARGVGALAVTGVEKAREINREHDISGKVVEAGSKAVSAASAVNEKYGIADKVTKGVSAAVSKAHEIEEKHHVTSKVASGVAFGLGKVAKGLDKLTEAASARRPSQGDAAP